MKDNFFAHVTKSPVYNDDRGFFAPTELTDRWVQVNISYNIAPYTFRGVHYQLKNTAQAKLVKVLKGSIIDFIVDIRPGSSRFGRMEDYRVNAGEEILVKAGYGHAFLTLEPDTIVQYMVDKPYNPETDRNWLWSSHPHLKSAVEYHSNFGEIVISDKDANAPKFLDADL